MCVIALSQIGCAAACSQDTLSGYGESEMLKRANAYIAANRDASSDEARGTYHFTPQIGWMNDPNGFVYFRGQYHIFYQYHPYDSVWGPMHWGHATSKDLVRWTHQPVALAPDAAYDADGCWSGSAIVVGDTLYLFYTGHTERNGVRVQTQNIAYSEDGVHFVKYEGNPVVGPEQVPEGTPVADFRDPYVFERDGQYFMLVGTLGNGVAKVETYRSEDLFRWEYAADFLSRSHAGYCWECPSLVTADGEDVFFCSPVDYPAEEYRFRNFNSCVYTTGKFNSQTGKMSASAFDETDGGLDFYAAQATQDPDGAVMIAWMNMWNRTNVTHELGYGWAGSFVLPRRLRVKDGKLLQTPVEGIAAYYTDEVRVSDTLEGTASYEGVSGKILRLKVTADVSDCRSFAVSLFKDDTHETTLTYDAQAGTVTFDRSESGYPIAGDAREASEGKRRTARYTPENEVLEMEIFLDKSSIEIFFGEGELVMTSLVYPPEGADGIAFSSEGSVRLDVTKNTVSG